jgi:MFS family permease
MPDAPLAAAARERTLSLSIREGVVWSVMWGFGEAYIAPFAIFLSAGPTAMALLGTLPPLLGAAGQILGAEIMERTRRRRPLVVIMAAIQGLSFIPLFLLPLVLPSAAVSSVLVVYCIATLLFSGNGPVWTSLMGDIVPERQRGRYFGVRTRATVTGMVVAMLAAGFVMSKFHAWNRPWIGFGLLFAIAAIARCFSAWLFHLHVDPPLSPRAPSYLSAPGGWRRLSATPYAYFIAVQTLLGAATAMAAPFYGLYMLRELRWTYTQFTVMTVVFLLAQVTVVRWWGLICDRHGNRAVFQAASLLVPIAPIVWFLTTNYYVLLAAQVLNGAAWAGYNLATSNYFYDSVPPAHRARVSSYQNLAFSIVNLLSAGVLGSFVARNFPTQLHFGSAAVTLTSALPVIFLWTGLLRLFMTVLLAPRMKEVRAIEPVSAAELIRRLAVAEPLLEQLGHLAARFGQHRAGNSRK